MRYSVDESIDSQLHVYYNVLYSKEVFKLIKACCSLKKLNCVPGSSRNISDDYKSGIWRIIWRHYSMELIFCQVNKFDDLHLCGTGYYLDLF